MENLRKLVAGLFYMGAQPSPGLVAVLIRPCLVNGAVLPGGAFDATCGLQVQAYVALRKGMQAVEHLAGHGVEARPRKRLLISTHRRYR